MGARWRRLTAEIARFLTVGGVATLVAVTLFNLLVHGWPGSGEMPLRHHAVLGYVIANSVGAVISYRGSRHWVFRHRETLHPDGGRTAYFVINTLTLALPVACLWFSRSVLGLDDQLSDNVSANVVGLAMGTAARFYLFRSLVFSSPRSHRHGAEVSAAATTAGSTRDRALRPGP